MPVKTVGLEDTVALGSVGCEGGVSIVFLLFCY